MHKRDFGDYTKATEPGKQVDEAYQAPTVKTTRLGFNLPRSNNKYE